LLEEIERSLIHGDDPMPLIGSVRWSEIVDWPKDMDEATSIKRKIARINEIVSALYSPLRATLMAFGSGAGTPYKMKGDATLPSVLSTGIEAQA
jgi:hypothetical protein